MEINKHQSTLNFNKLQTCWHNILRLSVSCKAHFCIPTIKTRKFKNWLLFNFLLLSVNSEFFCFTMGFVYRVQIASPLWEFKHEKTVDISRCHHLFSFSHKMASEGKAKKFYTEEVSLPRSG